MKTQVLITVTRILPIMSCSTQTARQVGGLRKITSTLAKIGLEAEFHRTMITVTILSKMKLGSNFPIGVIVEVIAEVEAVAEALSVEQGEIITQDLMTDTRPEHEMNLTREAVTLGRRDIITRMISEVQGLQTMMMKILRDVIEGSIYNMMAFQIRG